MNRHRTLPMTLALLLAFSGLLLAHPPVFGDSPSLEETYAPWKERVRVARAELDALKAKRQKAQEEYDDLLRYRLFWSLRLYRIDPIEDAEILSKLNELDQQVREKEHELTVTIPDEARQAGVPSSVLSQ